MRTNAAKATKVGGSTFGFKVTPQGLEQVPHPAMDAITTWTEDGRPVVDREELERGEFWADIQVDVDIWRDADGALFCGGLSIRTIPGALHATEVLRELSALNVLGPDVSAEITARLVRQVPVGALVEVALAGPRRTLQTYGDRLPASMIETLTGDAKAPRKGERKPGPTPALSDDMLAAVVAPAYLAGGRAPTKAVRQALVDAGFGNGHVTIDQARKAVARARRHGLIPPAKTR